MFENNVIKDYTGADAFGEIFIMLLIAFLLGWFARLLWDKFFVKKVVLVKDVVEKPIQKKVVRQENVQENVVEKKSKKAIESKKNERKSVKKTDKIIDAQPETSYASNGLKNDDLKIIEGIGPKIEILLKGAGINTWQDLSKTKVETLKTILKEGGDRFAFHEPTTWPEQASLAASENWQELEDFQVFLSGGRVHNNS